MESEWGALINSKLINQFIFLFIWEKWKLAGTRWIYCRNKPSGCPKPMTCIITMAIIKAIKHDGGGGMDGGPGPRVMRLLEWQWLLFWGSWPPRFVFLFVPFNTNQLSWPLMWPVSKVLIGPTLLQWCYKLVHVQSLSFMVPTPQLDWLQQVMSSFKSEFQRVVPVNYPESYCFTVRGTGK